MIWEQAQLLQLNLWEVEECVYVEQLDDWDATHLAFFFKKEDAVEYAEKYAGDMTRLNNEAGVAPEDVERILLEEGDSEAWVYMGSPIELAEVNRPHSMTYVYVHVKPRELEVK